MEEAIQDGPMKEPVEDLEGSVFGAVYCHGYTLIARQVLKLRNSLDAESKGFK